MTITGSTSRPVLELVDVTRIHGRGATAVHALRGVSLQVAAGELVAVMGPSGSGKSTLLNVAGGLDSATTGSVLVEGVDLATLSRADLAAVRRRAAGYVFQDLNLIPTLTAAENVALPLELDGRRRSRHHAMASLEDVGVADLADRYPDEMSGGQQQRVAIARALVGERRLVLALGSAGGQRIIGDTFQALLGMLDWNLSPQAALDLPRVANMNGSTELEDKGALPAQADALRKLGHQVQVRRHEGGLTAIRRSGDGWEGGADPRRDGVAKGE